MRALGLFAALCATDAWADEDRKGPPDGFFVGTYEIVGRAVTGETYSGTATIIKDGKRMSVKRCIGKKVTTGYLKYDETGHEQVPFLVGQLDEKTAASCEIDVDFNNYGRLTCYLRPRQDTGTPQHGLEFYVIAEDEAADGKQACTD